MSINRTPEERLAELISALPPAPRGWVEAAAELPAARAGLDQIVARAEEDAAFRKELIADLEATLAREGLEPNRPLIDELRRFLSDH